MSDILIYVLFKGKFDIEIVGYVCDEDVHSYLGRVGSAQGPRALEND